MTKQTKVAAPILAMAMSVLPHLCHADDLVSRMKALAQQKGKNAQQQKQHIQDQVAADKDQKEEEAARLAQVVQDAEQNAQQALLQDLANGKAAIINELTCTFENVKTKKDVNGTFDLRPDGVVQNKFVNLDSLFPGDPSYKHLAVSYAGGTGPDGVKFDLVDLNNGKSVVRSGSWSDLGLGDIAENCDQSQRIVSAKNGDVRVDTQNTVKRLTSNTVDAVEDGARTISSEAKAATGAR